MKFQYTKLPHGIKRAVIRIAVSHHEKVLPYFGAIDSGADVNLFHAELAPLLGLELEAGERREVGGVVEGERRAYFTHTVSLHVGIHPANEADAAPVTPSRFPVQKCVGQSARQNTSRSSE